MLFLAESAELWSLIGLSFGVAKRSGLNSIVTRTLQRMVRCHVPREPAQRSRTFFRLVLYGLGMWKEFSPVELRKVKVLLRYVAKSLDRWLDRVAEVKNPLSFYSIEEDCLEDVDNLMDVCSIQRPLPFYLVVPFWHLYETEKIGEGSYGEIYRTKWADGTERILKVIAVHGSPEDEDFEDVFIAKDVVADAVCSKYLSTLSDNGTFQAPNFPKVYSINLATGATPASLVRAWETYRDDPDTPETDHFNPDEYSQDSLFLVLELNDCGIGYITETEMDSLQALSLILQTASSLAVAERAFRFEHRDLHASNWLFKVTPKTHLRYVTDTWTWRLPTFHVQAFVIDFTMSRIEVDEKVFAMDLSFLKDEEVEDDEFQHSNHKAIYRMEETALEEDYTQFRPETNLLWLKYLAETLYAKLEASGDRHDPDDESGDADRIALHVLERIKRTVLNHSNTMDFVKRELFEIQNSVWGDEDFGQ